MGKPRRASKRLIKDWRRQIRKKHKIHRSVDRILKLEARTLFQKFSFLLSKKPKKLNKARFWRHFHEY